MSDEHSVSRRASLKSLGAMGAAIVFCGAGATPRAAEPNAAEMNQDKQPVNAVDLAAGRFAKGHS